MTFEVSKRFEFDAAHRLMEHPGKCKNIHGHRYVAEVVIQHNTSVVGEMASGMVIDFGVLKEVVGSWIDKAWDHCLILNDRDPLVSLLLTSQLGEDIPNMFLTVGDPTAENMAEILYRKARDLLYLSGPLDVASTLSPKETKIVTARIWETPTSVAEYREER